MSDGISNTGDDPLTVAQLLKTDGVEIFTIGVGLLDRTKLERVSIIADKRAVETQFLCWL